MCPRLLDTGGALCTHLNNIRVGDGQGRATGLSGKPAGSGVINLPQECGIMTFHYMNSDPTGFTVRVAHLKGKKKNGRSEQGSALVPWVMHCRKKKNEDATCFCVYPCSPRESDDFYVTFTKAVIFFYSFCLQCSCSIHSKR